MEVKVLFFTALLFTVALCDEETTKDAPEQKPGKENEDGLLVIELTKKSDRDITMLVQLMIEVRNGMIHMNNQSIQHNIVNHVHALLPVATGQNYNIKDAKLMNVRLRILVLEKIGENGENILLVEEEILEIEGDEVLQVTVHQVLFRSMIRQPMTIIPLRDSEIHKRPLDNDKHVYVSQRPRIISCYGFGRPNYRCRNSDKPFRKVQCWYQHLNLMEKITFFSAAALFLVFIVLVGCAICKRKQEKARRKKLKITSPVYNTLAVDIDDVKNGKATVIKDYDFHYEVENVSTNDKQPLVQEC